MKAQRKILTAIATAAVALTATTGSALAGTTGSANWGNNGAGGSECVARVQTSFSYSGGSVTVWPTANVGCTHSHAQTARLMLKRNGVIVSDSGIPNWWQASWGRWYGGGAVRGCGNYQSVVVHYVWLDQWYSYYATTGAPVYLCPR